MALLTKLPRTWASDTNYTNGSAAGTPTKADPGATLAAEGFVPGRAGAQHFNFELNAHSTAGRLALRNALVCHLADTGTTSESSLAAISAGQTSGILVIKSGASNVKLHGYSGGATTKGSVASITSLVTDAARSAAGRIVAIGTGGNECCFSVDNGANWSAGSNLAEVGGRIVYDTTNDEFIANSIVGPDIYHDADGNSTWSGVTTALDGGVTGGLAMLSGGTCYACGETLAAPGDPAFITSTDGGVTWSAVSADTVNDPTTYVDTGCVVGNEGSQIWHVGRRQAGVSLRISRSSGGAWTTVLNRNVGETYSARPRILCCPQTGLLVVIAPMNTSLALILASFDAGDTWLEVGTLPFTNYNDSAYALAGGRLFFTSTTNVFASSGLI
jgi:hypothetical protein